LQAGRGETASKIMWDEAAFASKSDHHMAVLMGMKQTENSILQIFCSHRLNKDQLAQSSASNPATNNAASVYNVDNMTSEERKLMILEQRRRDQILAAAKLGLKTRSAASEDQWLDLESKRHSKVRYLSVSFVCRSHSAAILEDGVGINKCLCNYMGQPFHLCVDPEFRNLSEHFATNNKNVLLSEMGIVPNVDKKKITVNLDLSIGKLATPRGLATVSSELFPLSDHIDETINSPAIVERKLYVYSDTAPKDVSKNALCAGVKVRMTSVPLEYFVIVAADEFDASEVDVASMSPAKAIAMRLVTLLVMITRHYSGYFDEVVIAVEANSFNLDFFKHQFDKLFYGNPYLVENISVEFVVHALSKAQMIKYRADDSRHFKEASLIQMRKECKRANREYDRVMQDIRSKNDQYNSNKYRRKLTARKRNHLLMSEDDSEGGGDDYSSSSSNDEDSDEDELLGARKQAGRKLTKRKGSIMSGLMNKFRKRCGTDSVHESFGCAEADRDVQSILEAEEMGAAAADRQRLTYNIGYLMQGEKVGVYHTFFSQIVNQGLLRCADHVITVSMFKPNSSVPYEISRQLSNVRLEMNKVTGKSTGEPDDLSVCTCMSWYIADRCSKGKGPMTVRLRPTKDLVERFKLHDSAANLDLSGCYSFNRNSHKTQTSFVVNQARIH
jgi:hypothetical protein